MKRLLIVTLAALFLVGCKPSGSEVKMPPNAIPDGLADCKFYSVNNGWTRLWVVRCPNSSTSVEYNCGKNCTRRVATDS